MMLAAMPVVGLMAILTWIAMAAIFRISSLAALVALAMSPLYALLLGRPEEAVVFAILAVLGWIRHSANVRRLLKGEEPRIGGSKSKPA
jgi:glycerol-3-phosphate acyltransferase PlsY